MTLGKTGNRLDLITNILTIVVAIVIIGLFIHRYILGPAPTSKSPQVGNPVALQAFNPSHHRMNVLLVLMKGCKFCEASMGFYKTLRERGEAKNLNVIVVFPPDTENLESYLAEYGLLGIDVKFSSLSELDVSGTPTIIVTDENGKVVKTWVGRLSGEAETEVLKFLDS